jgi:multidrug efflux system outer membrane protein
MRRLLLVAFLAGCTTVGPHYERPDLALPEKYIQEKETSAPSISPEWWTLYSDATLNELVASSRTRNAEMLLAAARVREAEAVLREAGALYVPEVTGGAAASRSRVSTRSLPAPAPGTVNREQYQALASTSFELDFWGRFARANEAAQAILLSSQLSQDTVSLTLAGATAQAYFALRSLDAQIAVLDNTLKVRRDSLAIVRSRAQAGLTSDLDVYQAEGALSDALVERADAQRQRALLERQLGVLTGRLDLKLAPGDLFALPLAPRPPAGLPSDLLERRPDIRSAEQNLVAANAQIGLVRAALFPSIALTASLGAQSAELSTLLSSGAGIWSLGFALAQPIFDGGRREARVEQAQARREQALAGYQRSVETAFREVADAIVNVEESARNEEQLRLRLEAARKALELSTLRYESGYSAYIEVLDAQRTANLAELVFVRNRQARLAFSVDLMKALGGGWKSGSEPE